MITVPPGVPASGAYAVPNRSTGPAAADADGAVDSAGLSAPVDGASVDGAGVVLVPPHAATRMVAPANRPTNFRIKAPPSCVGSWGNCSPQVAGRGFPPTSGHARVSQEKRVHTHARAQRPPAALGGKIAYRPTCVK